MRAIAIGCLLAAVTASAQGPLDPPEAPGESMRSLEQLWDAVTELRLQNAALSNELAETRMQLGNVSNQIVLTYNTAEAARIWALHAAEGTMAATARVAALASTMSLAVRAPILSTVETNKCSQPSLALTPDGRPAVAYVRFDDFSGGLYDLFYAEWTGARWAIQQVLTNGVVAEPSLAFTPSGQPAISYYDILGGSNLMYAGWGTASWNFHIVDSAGDVGAGNALAFTADGNPAISYCDLGANRIRYAGWNGAGWVLYDVFTNASSGGMDTSLAFTTNDMPAIAFYDAAGGSLRYSAWNGAGWNVSAVENAASAARPAVSLRLNGAGHPAIAYRDGAQLKYTEHDGVSWNEAALDTGADREVCLAFSPAGRPGIAYGTATFDLKLALWNGSAWSVRGAAAQSMGGFFGCSLAFSAGGHALLAYCPLVASLNGGPLCLAEIIPEP